MKILDYGDIIALRNIVFEDGKYDIEESHPGIVLLPTTEKDEEVVCLYMTSDKYRARRNANKYIRANSKIIKKQSFINLQQIIKTPNIKIMPLNELKNEDFYDLLDSFYNYQSNCENPNPIFDEIKGKVEIMLKLFEINDKLDLLNDVRIDPDELSKLEDKDNITMMHIAYLIKKGEIKLDQIPLDMLNQKDINYLKKLFDLYYKVNTIDFKNENNNFSKLYTDTVNSCYLINVNTLFGSLIEMLQLFEGNSDRVKMIEEMLREETEKAKIMEKENELKRTIEEIDFYKKKRRDSKQAHKRKLLEKKYGKFDFDYFDI